MKDCWALEPDSRPTFTSLEKQLSSYLESMASYVKLADAETRCYTGVGILQTNEGENCSVTKSPEPTVIETGV